MHFGMRFKIDVDRANMLSSMSSPNAQCDAAITTCRELSDTGCSFACLGQNDDHSLSESEVCVESVDSLIGLDNLIAGT